MSKAYVINLDKATDRWEKIQKTWSGIFNLERVSAVETSPGWIGCTLSHIKTVEEAKERGDPYILVFEDDCIPQSNKSVHAIKKLWDEAYQILTANTDAWDIVIGASTAIYDSEPTIDNKLSGLFVKIFRLPRGSTAHWILYNASVYDKIISWKNGPRTKVIDEIFDCAQVFVTVPFMAVQDECYSYLQNSVTNYSANFEKTEKYLLSKINHE